MYSFNHPTTIPFGRYVLIKHPDHGWGIGYAWKENEAREDKIFVEFYLPNIWCPAQAINDFLYWTDFPN